MAILIYRYYVLHCKKFLKEGTLADYELELKTLKNRDKGVKWQIYLVNKKNGLVLRKEQNF